MFEPGQNVILSKFSKKAYFRSKNGKLLYAPIKPDGTIDYRESNVVDYFFLTTDEWEEAFMVLDILEENDEIH